MKRIAEIDVHVNVEIDVAVTAVEDADKDQVSDKNTEYLILILKEIKLGVFPSFAFLPNIQSKLKIEDFWIKNGFYYFDQTSLMMRWQR